VKQPTLELHVTEAAAAPGGALYGTLVVSVDQITHSEDVWVRLVATPGKGVSGVGHEVARDTLHTGQVLPGRHELAFEIAIPQDIASYDGETFSVTLALEGVFEGYPKDTTTDPVEVTVAREGALQVAAAAHSLAPLEQGRPGAGTIAGITVVAGFVGGMIGTVFGGLMLWVLPTVFAVMGFFVAIAIVVTARATVATYLQQFDVHVSPIDGGLAVDVELIAGANIELESVEISLLTRETVYAYDETSTSRTFAHNAAILAQNMTMANGEQLDLRHEFQWKDDDYPSLNAGKNRLAWQVEVVADARANPPMVVRVPIDVGTGEFESQGSVVATEVP
jgi:hypothetical protein